MRSSTSLVAILAGALAVAGCPSGEESPEPAPKGVPLTQACLDHDGDGVPGSGQCQGIEPLDCDDRDPDRFPGSAEACDGRDNDCDEASDEGLTVSTYYRDDDRDGFGGVPAGEGCGAPPEGTVSIAGDCDDGQWAVRPGAEERCDGVDEDCNGAIDDGLTTRSFYPDGDGDGYGDASAPAQVTCSASIPGKVQNPGDCDDAKAAVNPGAVEACNRIDDDCDGQLDEGLTVTEYYPDGDGDGFGRSGAAPEPYCSPIAGKVANALDCDDASPAARPTAAEVCNGVDDDCDGQVDDSLVFVTYFPDRDRDGYGAAASAGQSACAPIADSSTVSGDCDDANLQVHPGGAEACNAVDDDCDGQVDDGNPGGGSSCNTGQPGRCAAGTLACQSGSVVCVRQQGPSAERCNAADDDCDGAADEDFPQLGASCTAGEGVCQRSGTVVCSGDQSAAVCSATPAAPTAATCDGLDNDCDGVVDEPVLTSTTDVASSAWHDLEVQPYYFSAGSCAGGTAGTGNDSLAGGGLVMGAGAQGLAFQRLDTSGAPVGTPTKLVSSLVYSDVALAQAGDGFVVAGAWVNSEQIPIEVDLYYVEQSSGKVRAQLWSQFNTGNRLDSLRLVRGNGRRVVLLWRESGVGIRFARVEPLLDASTGTWRLEAPGGGSVSSTVLIASADIRPGLGADSTHWDWGGTQSCPGAGALRSLAVAYLPDDQNLYTLQLNEDGSGRGAETPLIETSGAVTLQEPEVVFFRVQAGDQWFVAFTSADPAASPPRQDLNYWVSTDPASVGYAYLDYAAENGVDSIRRPRASVTFGQIWLTALRYVGDAAGFERQMMSRRLDLSGNRLPDTSEVEQSATRGACGATEPSCRPGDKDGLTQWATFGRIYFAGSGSSPAGSYTSTLSCD